MTGTATNVRPSRAFTPKSLERWQRLEDVLRQRRRFDLRLARAHVQRRVRLGLHDLDQAFPHQLQDRDERDGHAHAPLLRAE